MSKVESDALEELLRHAAPRPVPAPGEVAAAKAAVRDEWLDASNRRRTRRQVAGFAIAASLLVGLLMSVGVFRAPVVEVVQVAAIEKSFGPVYLLGDQAELRPTEGLANVTSGQTIVTGADAGLALAWGEGGSLRVDEKTRLRFVDQDAIYLESGRAYFDSVPSLLKGTKTGNAVNFAMVTDHGTVRHTGTQFMTSVDADTLVVSVREGEVAIDGVYHDRRISSGQQAMLAGQQQPSILNISRAGQAWGWVAGTTPAAEVNGKSLHEFLVWVCREMGLELRFEGRAEAVAHEAILKGTIDTVPAEALRLRLATAALEWRIEGGVVYITD